MKKSISMVNFFAFIFAMIMTTSILAQQPTIQNWRPYDQTGVNVFEPAKDLDTEFDGLKVRIGGAFTQQFQALSHENDTTFSGAQLYDLGNGFNTATANLNLDVQMADGIRLALENYMSSRHHLEFWVKGGYIQFDKLPMFDNTDWFDKFVRVKIGHFQPNFGDQQFRRSDNGNAMYNPFVGNYVMDAFTTEIGGEIYVFPANGFMAMVGLTSGLIKGDVAAPDEGKAKQPSVYLKLAYDNTNENDLRYRLSASFMMNNSTVRNTIYGGDRGGSRYYGPMEDAGANLGSAFTSGRWNPGFTNKIMAIQANPFIKFKGLEFFGIFEYSMGNQYSAIPEKGFGFVDDDRSVTQLGGELIYRFLKSEQLYVGFKFNQISGELSQNYRKDDGSGGFVESNINRIAVAAGWFPIKNLLLKVEYVNQEYSNFPSTSKYYGGTGTDNGNIVSGVPHEYTNKAGFNGVVIEAVAAF